VAGVVHVEVDALVVAEVVATGHLPQAGEAGPHRQHLIHRLAIAGQLFANDWPRPDHTHLPPQHVHELGQFIEAGAAQEFAQAGDARIVLELEIVAELLRQIGGFRQQPAEHPIGVAPHGAELDTAEAAVIAADPLLHVEHWPARGELHQ